MLGYNFYSNSKRYLPPPVCTKIQAGLERRGVQVATAGIFVNEELERIERIVAACHINLAQLSGSEPAADLEKLGDRGLKAIRPRNQSEADTLVKDLPLRTFPPAVLVDTYQRGEFGGTGHTGDWEIAKHLSGSTKILLAGGLTPENVGQAVGVVQPWGVDVATGVERSPGLKDPEKMKRFVANAHKAVNL
jgi:phosphoribosylanthranilate isomerase